MPETTFPRAARPWPAERIPQGEPGDLALRQHVEFRCPRGGHVFSVPFATNDAEIPDSWDCRAHGVSGLRLGCTKPPPSKIKHGDRRRLGNDDGRTHWDRLLERRTIPALEALLNERLDDLAACRKRKVQPAPAPKGSKTASGR